MDGLTWDTARTSLGWCRQCAQPLAATSRTRCAQHLEQHRLEQRRRRTTAEEKWKRVARQSVWKALQRGKMTRPSRCEQCEGEGVIHAHHPDYAKRREVQWLCLVCHALTHRSG